nr:nucleoside hydrolase [Microbacterium esteraromaticum]
MKVLIDTDPGMDDALAISVAHKSDALKIVALTAVTGNLPSDRTVANILRVLDLLDAPEIPVAQGPVVPLGGATRQTRSRTAPMVLRSPTFRHPPAASTLAAPRS